MTETREAVTQWLQTRPRSAAEVAGREWRVEWDRDYDSPFFVLISPSGRRELCDSLAEVQAAVAEYERILEARVAEEIAEESRLAELRRIAKETGKSQLVREWITEECCNGEWENCSHDFATERVLPSGKIKITYTCTH